MSMVISLSLVGCHSRALRSTEPAPASSGNATWQVVNAPGEAHYNLALGEVASGGSPFSRLAPLYPPGMLASCSPTVSVSALLIVDTQGRVNEVRFAAKPEASAGRKAFIDAVRVAALKWQFNPLQMDHWAADANGISHVVDSKVRPFSQTYLFHFTCHAGKARVASDAAGASGS